MLDVERYEGRLRARMAELYERISRTEAELNQPGDPDIEDQAGERQEDEVAEGLEAAALEEIKRIRAALARIEGGRYGQCVACGEPISSERLEAVPHAERCKRCAA